MAKVIGIVVAHGGLADELIRTASQVVGPVDDCYAITNSGKAPVQLREEIGQVIDGAGGGPAILLTDFVGGSCNHASMMVESERKDVVVFAGVNLPMLLAFVNKREELSFEELPQAILERANASIHLCDPAKP